MRSTILRLENRGKINPEQHQHSIKKKINLLLQLKK
jgi:hypothetical protein